MKKEEREIILRLKYLKETPKLKLRVNFSLIEI